MNSAKQYINIPITYSREDKLLETKLFQEIGRAMQTVRKSKRKTGLTGVRKIFAEKSWK
jgi:hypothetical protein